MDSEKKKRSIENYIKNFTLNFIWEMALLGKRLIIKKLNLNLITRRELLLKQKKKIN